MIRFLFPLLCLAIPMALPAADPEERFVVQGHPVELREGPASGDRVTALLTPGERVRVIKILNKERQVRVERSQGESGWVAAEDLLGQAPLSPPGPNPPTRTPEGLQQELSQLQLELAKSQTAAAEILRVQAERDQLQNQVIHLKRDIERLRQENSALDADEKQTWFLVGGALLIAGIVLGVLLPRIRVGRRQHWGSF